MRPESKRGERPRLVVALTFPVHPPLGGGQVRTFNLYRGLAAAFDIELVTLTSHAAPERHRELAPGLHEHTIPKSARHMELELELERRAGTVVTDIAMAELYEHTPAYLEALREATHGARAAVASHPYTFPAIRAVSDGPVWYEAHNVEASLKRTVLGDGEEAQRLLALAEETERSCCEEAELVWACSAEDRQELIRRYGAEDERVLVVPNGAAVDDVDYLEPAARQALRERLRIADRSLAIFIASWHHPNVLGARRLLRVAEECPEVEFLILGSVGLALADDPAPDNVQLPGPVSAGLKQSALSVADAALNSVTTGSGTNLKMLEYFGAGVPVISTSFGARGLGVRAGEHFLPAEPAEFPRALRALREMPLSSVERLVRDAHSFVLERLSWSVIAGELLAELRARDLRVSPAI
ncbi:MAG: glycosyltransferase family 4 protein [Solirubrobacteraceae bacterium]